MKWITRVVLILVVLAAVLAVAGLLLPRKVRVERSTVVNAPRSTLFALVNSFTLFNKWSPWFALDPQAKYVYTGPAIGVGARMSWVGDPGTMGSGSQEIVESHAYERVITSVDFGARGTSMLTFTISPAGQGMRVNWAMETDLGMNPVSRYFGILIDRMVGGDFERGLAGLKTLAESLPRTDFAGLSPETVDVKRVEMAYVRASSGRKDTEVAAALGKAYAEIGAFMKANKLSQAGAPLAITTKLTDAAFEFEAAVPVSGTPPKPVPADSAVQLKQSYGGRAMKVVLKGTYSGLLRLEEQALAYAAAYGLELNGPIWAEFATDPGTVKEPDIITNVWVPIK